MQKTTNLKRNYIYNVSYQILAVLTPLITTPYLSRVLGAERIGDYSYTQSVVAIFALFAALGTLIYGNREIENFYTDSPENDGPMMNLAKHAFVVKGNKITQVK